jgi:hypothetical protein
MTRHQWTKEDIREVFGTCQDNPNRRDRLRILKSKFPDCTVGSLGYAIIRYQKRNDNTLRWIPEQGIYEGYGANGKLQEEVWNERDWRMMHVL